MTNHTALPSALQQEKKRCQFFDAFDALPAEIRKGIREASDDMRAEWEVKTLLKMGLSAPQIATMLRKASDPINADIAPKNQAGE